MVTALDPIMGANAVLREVLNRKEKHAQNLAQSKSPPGCK